MPSLITFFIIPLFAIACLTRCRLTETFDISRLLLFLVDWQSNTRGSLRDFQIKHSFFFLSARAAVLQRKTKSKQRDIAWRTKIIISCIFTSKTVLETLWMIFGSSHLVSSYPKISQSTGITSQQLVGIRKYFNFQGLEQLDFHPPCVTFMRERIG